MKTPQNPHSCMLCVSTPCTTSVMLKPMPCTTSVMLKPMPCTTSVMLKPLPRDVSPCFQGTYGQTFRRQSMHSRLLARHKHACRSAATMQDTSSHFRKCCIPHTSKAASKTAQNKSYEQRSVKQSVKQNALALHHLHSHVDLRIQICIQTHLFKKFCLLLQDLSVLRSLSMGFLQFVVQHI